MGVVKTIDNDLTNQCCQPKGDQLIIKDKPLIIEECEGDEIRYPACVMTRAMARMVARDSRDICDLSDTRVSHENGMDEVIGKTGDIYIERNVLFNDALNTFYLRLYGVRHMVKDHSDSEKGNPLPPHRLLLSINSKGSFICAIPQTA